MISGERSRLPEECHNLWKDSGGGLWLVGLSGGADSVALFRACIRAGIPLEAAHCNFNLRGEESLRDRDFVRNLCDDAGIPLHLAEFKTSDENEKGESIEMTCRRLRYDFFKTLLEKYNFSRIAIAHNADDNIETFFINALRGCGTKGLKGMSRDTGSVIRPLLNFNRSEILGFLDEENQKFIIDSTNLRSDYRRNFLRNEVFPLIKSKWPGFQKALTSTIRIQARENRIVEAAVEESLSDCKEFLPWDKVRDFPDPETLIFHFIRAFGGTSVDAAEISRFVENPVSGKYLELKNDNKAIVTRDGLLISSGLTRGTFEKGNSAKATWTELDPKEIKREEIIFSPLSEAYLPFPPHRYAWRAADRKMTIKPLGMSGSQNVWKILKDKGIPALLRESVKVLVDKESGDAIWIPGIKRSRLHLINGDNKSIFRVIFV